MADINNEKWEGREVRFVECMDEGDADARMLVVEDRDDRVLVRDLLLNDWAIQPTSVYPKYQLEFINDDVDPKVEVLADDLCIRCDAKKASTPEGFCLSCELEVHYASTLNHGYLR